jgi:hypothetical protein
MMRRYTGLLSAILVSLALSLAAAPAQACKCSNRDPPTLVRPEWPASSGLVLVSETIDLDCKTSHDCHWRSVHVYQRSGPGEPARVPVRLPFSGSDPLQVRWGGLEVEPLDWAWEDPRRTEMLEAIYAERGRVPPSTPYNESGDDLGQMFWLEDDGQRTEIVLEIEGRPYSISEPPDEGFQTERCCHYNALQLRHPWVPTYTQRGEWVWVDEHADAMAPSAQTQIDVELAHGLAVEHDGAEQRGEIELHGLSRPGLRWSVVDHGRLKGGPFIAAGGAILDANPARGRIGWEHAEPLPFLFYSAALETDFVRELTVVPAIELTHGRTRVMWFVPCAGLGVGAPVQVLPDVRPGLRVQASLSWRVFSFLTIFDWLPKLAPTDAGVERPTMFKLAFMGQLSF